MVDTQVLLTGAGGQVGAELAQRLAPQVNLIAADRQRCDLSQPQALYDQVMALAPTLIINAAAYTAVDRAETEPELAQRVNAEAPGQLAAAATELGASLVHMSTDYVFDGSQSHPYQETDAPAPLGIYGQSKLAGEEAVRQGCDRHVILRTAWVYGTQGKGNFVKTMLRLGREREELRVVYDQVGTPTWAGDIAAAIGDLLPQLGPETYGTYHFTNSGVASWYDLAVATFAEAEALGLPLALERVVPITTPEYPTPAARPAYSVLATEKITQQLGHRAPHWQSALRTMLAEYVPTLLAS